MMNKKFWDESCIFLPSLICLDMMHLNEQVAQLQKNNINGIHVDIIDGHFSPSMPLGFETVRQLRAEYPNAVMDCHVMTEEPEYFIDELVDIGVQEIVLHVETAKHADGLINRIHEKGIRAGLALKPSTPLTVLEYEIEKCDAILLMQINPGYASSKKESKVVFSKRKIMDLRNMISARSLDTKIILDGRVSLEDVESYGRDIVNMFVIGSTCMNKSNLTEGIQRLNSLRNTLLER